ncbi:sulfite exporter TauE/SafE family protein, partial [Vibrio alginolyticus]
MTVSLFLLLLALGAFVGVMAGLLGIGGGLIVVPALLFLLPWA